MVCLDLQLSRKIVSSSPLSRNEIKIGIYVKFSAALYKSYVLHLGKVIWILRLILKFIDRIKSRRRRLLCYAILNFKFPSTNRSTKLIYRMIAHKIEIYRINWSYMKLHKMEDNPGNRT